MNLVWMSGIISVWKEVPPHERWSGSGLLTSKTVHSLFTRSMQCVLSYECLTPYSHSLLGLKRRPV